MESSERAQKWHVAMDIFNSATLKRAPRKRVASWNVEAWMEMNHLSHRTSLTSLLLKWFYETWFGGNYLGHLLLDYLTTRLPGDGEDVATIIYLAREDTWSYKETLTQATNSNGKSSIFQQDVHLERVHVPLPCYIPFLECALQKNSWWIISTSSVEMFYPRTVSQKLLDWYGHSRKETG